MSSVPRLLVMGLPEVGKTTFLAALWHVTESEEIPSALCLSRISESAKHLNTITNDWLQYRPMNRTVPEQEEYSSLWLKEKDGREIGEVVFSDLSGETFRDQWKNREWSSAYASLVGDASAILLFLHPDQVKEPFTITEIQKLTEAAFPEATPETKPAEAEGEVIVPSRNQVAVGSDQRLGSKEVEKGSGEAWDIESVPTQVKMVGLLQFVQPYLSLKPTRLAIIVSAWDKILAVDSQADPQTWVSRRLPYLAQYISSNPECFENRVYGVSAQGGDLKADLGRLQDCRNASERVLIAGPDCQPHDITEPIRWALSSSST